MAKYRKKPVVIEAVQFCDDSFETTEKLQNLGLDPIRIGYENKELFYPADHFCLHNISGSRCSLSFLLRGVNRLAGAG